MLGQQHLALPILAVKETLPARPLTRLFLVPPVVAGLVNLRGEIVAVLDLGALLELRSSPALARTLVVLRGKQNRPVAALLVDALDGVRELDAEAVQPPPATLAADQASYLEGVASMVAMDGAPPCPLLVLSPARLVESERLKSLRRAERARAGHEAA
jgi:purine-binding chemotaxis protein CheW